MTSARSIDRKLELDYEQAAWTATLRQRHVEEEAANYGVHAALLPNAVPLETCMCCMLSWRRSIMLACARRLHALAEPGGTKFLGPNKCNPQGNYCCRMFRDDIGFNFK